MCKTTKSEIKIIKLQEPCSYVHKFSSQYNKFMAYKKQILFEAFFNSLKNQFYKKSYERQKLRFLSQKSNSKCIANLFRKMKAISAKRMSLYSGVIGLNKV